MFKTSKNINVNRIIINIWRSFGGWGGGLYITHITFVFFVTVVDNICEHVVQNTTKYLGFQTNCIIWPPFISEPNTRSETRSTWSLFNSQHTSPNGLSTAHHRALQGPLYLCVNSLREGQYVGTRDSDYDKRRSQCQAMSIGSTYVLAMRIKRPSAQRTCDASYHLALSRQKILHDGLPNQVH
jgi:hypothetical protein